jgi:hypothetical protein
MKTPYRLALLFVTTALSACSTVTVTTDYDRAAAFGNYRTYSIAPGPDGLDLPMYCEITLRKVVRSELAARGLTEAEGKDGKAADLAIVWRVFLQGRTSAQERVDPEGELAYAYGDYTYWTGMPANLSDSTRYPEGTLVLDVVDMKTEKLVFRGTGTAVAMGPEKGARNIEKAVKEMVAALPRVHP